MIVLIASERRSRSACSSLLGDTLESAWTAASKRVARDRVASVEHALGARTDLVERRLLQQRGRGVGEQRCLALALLGLGCAAARARRELARDDRDDHVHSSAVQLRPSASVSVCTGGRNKKLNATIDATATTTA